ncbi:MAG TPA: hypothetical protein PL105_11215 [Caldilineaceae bacterium]|nr:hypothetical protein [Caldilineaceae bacterium]
METFSGRATSPALFADRVDRVAWQDGRRMKTALRPPHPAIPTPAMGPSGFSVPV